MSLPALGAFIEAVQTNCHIADARHAREMTLCTYLLEMRDFYRWERELPHGQPIPREDVSRWIAEREALWEQLVEEDYGPLPLAGEYFEPFAVEEINRRLKPLGLVYGAGIGRFGKPHFFLAQLEREEERDGLNVLVCGCEYARDILALPAALQGSMVVVRREALSQWLAEKLEAWSMKQGEGSMARALSAWGGDLSDALERMTDDVQETLILHEQGEHRAGRILGSAWESMLAGFTRRRPEILARAVRDNWADCLTTLPALLRPGKEAGLHFWFANFDAMRKALFPALAAAHEEWRASGCTGALATVADKGREHWQNVALQLLERHRLEGEAALESLSQDLTPISL